MLLYSSGHVVIDFTPSITEHQIHEQYYISMTIFQIKLFNDVVPSSISATHVSAHSFKTDHTCYRVAMHSLS